MNFKIEIQTLIKGEISFIYLSDLHLETDKKLSDFNNIVSKKNADVAILAGDIATGTDAIYFINHLINLGYIVIYVLGNHEFWGHEINNIIQNWRNISDKTEGLFFLEKDTLTINNIDFIGTCLWSSLGTKDISEPIDWFLKYALKNARDFELIKNFKPDYMRRYFFDAKNYIFNQLNPDRQQVVITHYAPSEQSSLDVFKGDTTRPLWFTELGHEIAYSNIIYWIHGHMHNSSDYFIYNTNILCNPRGYVDYNMVNNDFQKQIIKTIKIN